MNDTDKLKKHTPLTGQVYILGAYLCSAPPEQVSPATRRYLKHRHDHQQSTNIKHAEYVYATNTTMYLHKYYHWHLYSSDT